MSHSPDTLFFMSVLTHDTRVMGLIDHPNCHWIVMCSVCGTVGDQTDDHDEADVWAKQHTTQNS